MILTLSSGGDPEVFLLLYSVFIRPSAACSWWSFGMKSVPCSHSESLEMLLSCEPASQLKKPPRKKTIETLELEFFSTCVAVLFFWTESIQQGC